MDKVFVTTGGIILIAAIYWFFFGKKETGGEASENITVTVDGGYKPGTIVIPEDKSVKLTFIRRDPNSCLEEVVFPDYKIKKYLPLSTPVEITLTPPHFDKSGFRCGMNMYKGKIIIKKS